MKTVRKNISGEKTALAFLIVLFIGLVMLGTPFTASASVSVGVSVTVGPPALPVYTQPLCPGPGFIWLPGYWAWDPEFGYYWVPGMWAPAPFIGALWTPGYWGWNDGLYIWHDGYWGPTVGFYGGINYGFGYTGTGYYGGYWRGGTYYYNRTVNNISVTNITNVYSRPVGHVRPAGPSFHGGRGGTTIRPTPEQVTAERERHAPPTNDQMHQARLAREDRMQRATVNNGRPAVAATRKPGSFTGPGFVPAERAGSATSPRREKQGTAGEHVRGPRTAPEYRQTPGPGYGRPAERAYPRQGDVRSSERRPAPGPGYARPGERTAPQGEQRYREQQRPAPKPHPVQPRPQREQGMGERGEPR